jgi:hypothetical protein
MADDNNVEVRFDASTDGFEEGVGRAKAAVEAYVGSIKRASGELNRMAESASDAGGRLSAALTDHQAARMAADDARSQMQMANLVYQNEMEKLKTSLALHEITEEQKTTATIAAINERLAAQLAAIDKQETQAKGDVVKLNRLEEERTTIAKKAANDIEKANDQAALKTAQEWKAAADQVASAFNSQLQKLLAGTEKWSQAMKNIAADLVLKMIEQQVKLTLEWLANQARIVASHIAAETGMTTATEAGAALRSAAEVASGQTSILAVIADALKSIYASGGKAGAEVAAAVAPEAGPAAPAIGATAGAAVVATAIGVMAGSKFDLGTDYVLRGGLAMIHQGETIVPAMARGTGPYTGRGGAAQVHAPVSVNISALDSRSVERFFHDNAKHMIRAINNGIKSGAHLGLRGARA